MFKFKENNTTPIREILAGLTTTLALVPEALSFTFLAGVSPMTGIYTAFMICLLTAVFGGRPGMISGAAGSVAVVFVSLTATHGVEYLFSAVVLMGVIQILFGLLKFGKYVRLIPHSVMLGFVNGLAILIFLAQLEMFKVDDHWLQGTNMHLMLALVLLTMLIAYFLPKLTTRIPSSLVAIVTTTIIVLVLHQYTNVSVLNVKDFAQSSLSGGLPTFHLPNIPYTWETFELILPYSFIAALVGLVESLLTLNLVDEITDTKGNPNQESVGQGIANVATGCISGMGGCAMIGQTTINMNSGGRTRLSGIATAIGLLGFIMLGPKLLEMIPLPALAGVMFIVVIKTFAWDSLYNFKKIGHTDLAVMLLVTVTTIFANLGTAVLVGVVVSALIFAWQKGEKIRVTIVDKQADKLVYQIHGPLFFGSVTNFIDLIAIKSDKTIVLDFMDSNLADYSAVNAIISLKEKSNADIRLVNLNAHSQRMLNRAQLESVHQ